MRIQNINSIELARFHSFANKMPVMYGTMAIIMASKMYVFAATAPLLIGCVGPGALALFAAVRGIRWLRIRNRLVDEEEARSGLAVATRLLYAACVLTVVVDLALYSYGNEEQRNFISLQLAMECFAIFFYVMQLETAAIMIIVIGMLPAMAMYASTATPSGYAAAATVIVLALAMVNSMRTYKLEFLSLVKSHADLARLGEENARLASTDMITQLPNRREFFRVLNDRHGKAQQSGSKLAVGIVDLDGFKLVNDTHGHKTGDRVLVEISDRLRAVGANRADFFRIGGDEFAFLCTGAPTEGDMLAFGNDIMAVITPQIIAGTVVCSVGCSIGIAIYPDAAPTVDLLYECADFALYAAKRGGRMRAVMFDAEHRSKMKEQGAVEQALRIADLDRELYPLFQPITHVASGKAIGFEVLARWHSPMLGPVSPAIFIPIAEQAGLISRITKAMFRKALSAMADWPADVKLSFNLSSHDIVNRGTLLELIATAARRGIAPSRIGFELTETAFFYNFDAVREHVDLLQAAGFSVALDDFGAGYSSLSHVHALPLNRLKIDRSFIVDIETNETSRNIVRSIMKLCGDLEIECVIEGAETREQIDLLTSDGCAIIQGYFFSKPIEADMLGPFLHRLGPKEAEDAA